MIGIIYLVTNMFNGKKYIGQTSQKLLKRKSQHERAKDNLYFHGALKKYGKENFKWEILCECDTKEEMEEMEFHYIKQYHTYIKDPLCHGYNFTEGGICLFGTSNPSYGKGYLKSGSNHWTKKCSIEELVRYKEKISGNNNGFKKVAHLYSGDNHWLKTKDDEFIQKFKEQATKNLLSKDQSGDNHWTVKHGGFSESHLENLKLSLKNRRSYIGENNPMFNKGEKLKAEKNGRALKRIIITPNGEKFYCNGTFKKFCKNYCTQLKPNPAKKYFSKIIKENKEIDGWNIITLKEDLKDISEYIIYN